jgi:hypothetical protein
VAGLALPSRRTVARRAVLVGEDGDSAGGRRARLGLVLAGLMVVGAPSLASAQIVPVAVPTPVEDVTEEVTDTVDEVTKELKKRAKKARRKASQAVDDANRATKNATRKTRRDPRQHETKVAPRATPQAKGKARKPDRKRNRRDRTAQEENSRGDKNENGDINRLVDAGDEIEGTQVEALQVEPEPQGRREALPLTGFDPRTFVLMGFTMIVAGIILVTARPRPRPAPGW